MAKLSARGQKEEYRLVKECDHPASPLISWERETIAVMDSGKVLIKRDVRFVNPIPGTKELHSYGWHISAKRYPTHAERVAYGAKKLAAGWKVVPR